MLTEINSNNAGTPKFKKQLQQKYNCPTFFVNKFWLKTSPGNLEQK